jgi:hypothetical protein
MRHNQEAEEHRVSHHVHWVIRFEIADTSRAPLEMSAEVTPVSNARFPTSYPPVAPERFQRNCWQSPVGQEPTERKVSGI